MRCSVVIPFHTNSNLLETSVILAASAAEECGEYEIIVVDDSPCKRIPTAVQNLCKVIATAETLGYSSACNAGLAVAKGEYVFIMDADVFPERDAIAKLLKWSANCKEELAVSAQVLRTSDLRVHHYGIAFMETDVLKPYRGGMFPAPLIAKHMRIQAITSDSMLIRRSVLNDVGGFDTAYANSYCDLDLSFRLRETGVHISICHEAVTYHRSRSAGVARTKGEEDHKCRFYKQWGHSIENDFNSLIDASLRTNNAIAQKHRPFVAFNMMRSLYADLYQDCLAKTTSISAEWQRAEPANISGPIRLEDVVPWSLVTGSTPLLFLVDSVDDLSRNGFIAANRSSCGDLCIDRNGNTLLLKNISVSER